MVSRTTTTYTLVIMAFAQSFMGAAAVSGNAQDLETSGRQLFSGLALFADGYKVTHPTAEYMSSAPAVYEPTQQATSIGGYHAPKSHPRPHPRSHPHPHPHPQPVPVPAPIHESPKYGAAPAPYSHRPEYPIPQPKPQPTYAPQPEPQPIYAPTPTPQPEPAYGASPQPQPEPFYTPAPAPAPAPTPLPQYAAAPEPEYDTIPIPVLTTITHCVPTYITHTKPTTIIYTTPISITIYQSVPTTTTTTEVCICTSTATSTVTATTTSTAVVTNVSSITITYPNPPVIIPTTIISTSHYTETLISQVFCTATEQVTDTKTKYTTCWDTVVECCPVTVCQHMCDTYYYTSTKTCIDYSIVTVKHPCTEYVPSQVCVTNTKYQTITLCQPVTVTTSVTDYDTICQIITVNHTATVTKPILVVQNIYTDACTPPPPPPVYGAAPVAAPATLGVISNYQFTSDPYANADDEKLNADATAAAHPVIKKPTKRASTLNKTKPQIRVKEPAQPDIVPHKA
ncbi:hypothetical protein LPJ66_001278 [Kickxella alabastrina]|uniref:Uncharacterized protein n=1 Tax=Kickxella alabastrina TaxID=61397 RepID=A0ACC1ITU1_9FUNG|nr:hypothetical protein LPJ66_001278 [Kickxella alabastrina]